ncbi:unnamed protein product [Caretta caretta]
MCNNPPGSSGVENEVATDDTPSTVSNSVLDAKSDRALLTPPVEEKEGMAQPLRRSQREVRPSQRLTYDVLRVSSEVSILTVRRGVDVLKDFKTHMWSPNQNMYRLRMSSGVFYGGADLRLDA